jgi:hypothetical protein
MASTRITKLVQKGTEKGPEILQKMYGKNQNYCRKCVERPSRNTEERNIERAGPDQLQTM